MRKHCKEEIRKGMFPTTTSKNGLVIKIELVLLLHEVFIHCKILLLSLFKQDFKAVCSPFNGTWFNGKLRKTLKLFNFGRFTLFSLQLYLPYI